MLQLEGLCRGLHPRNVVTHNNILLLTILLTSGNSTGLSAEGITGRVLLILSDVILLLVWALLVATCALSLYRNGNHLSVHLAIYDFCVIEPPNFYCSVI